VIRENSKETLRAAVDSGKSARRGHGGSSKCVPDYDIAESRRLVLVMEFFRGIAARRIERGSLPAQAAALRCSPRWRRFIRLESSTGI